MVRELLKRINPEKACYFDMTELETIEQLLKTGGKETARSWELVFSPSRDYSPKNT